ncbi:MAG: spermine synthase [Candidatus Omnitrophica bacterium]|nr:spermine synthase [Candidatus Omnitrophota bacterium]
MRKRLLFSLLVMGLSGIVAQVLLLRELLIIFYGNELSVGIILANWLIIEAMGAFLLGKKVEDLRWKWEGFLILQIIFSISFPSSIYFTRIVREIFGIATGEGLGLVSIFFFSFLVLFPVSITHGALFTFGCKIFSPYASSEAQGIGRVYIYETIGTILGGIFFTYLLLPYLNSFQIAFLITLINFFLCILLSGKFWRGYLLNKIIGFISLILFFLNIFLFFNKGVEKIHWSSLKKQWKGYLVRHYQNSFFGNIVVTEKEKTLYFFFNGLPLITLPHPDIYYLEGFSHFSCLSHPSPRKILIIGGGAGGLINEILKHPVEEIDYVELDPVFLKTIKKFPLPLTDWELNNPKVKIFYFDGRLFLKKTDKKYDLILLGFSNPSDLQINRYFSREFFLLVKERLKEGGIFAFNLPSLPRAVLNLEGIRDLNACILNTLKEVFSFIKIIPGEGNNLFLASESKNLNSIEAKLLIARKEERKIIASLFFPAYIEYRFQPWWLENFFSSLKSATRKINHDFKPLATFYSLAYWNAIFSPYFSWIFLRIEKLGFPLAIIFFSIFIYIFLTRRIHLSISLSLATTGFAGMLFDLMVIFSFQVFYGYVFHWIGILITAFMFGTVTGGYAINRNLEKIKKKRFLFSLIEWLIIIFSGIVFTVTKISPENPFIFLFISFLGGIPVGMQFPLANKLYLEKGYPLGRTAGILYAVDLLGGWMGGIWGGVFLLPFLGVFNTCLVIAMIKLATVLAFIFAKNVER